ncbi:hypothetical protein K1719_026639 [Acacia pycnantha]|nr:hypothetical protein K1719_026639 [Acacia pycnantha]
MCDRLSSIPDALLHHILSFLPTTEAIAASFLSKRWRPLAHSFSTLVIHDKHFPGREVFIQFVDYVLISGDYLKGLKNFGLSCWFCNVPNHKINNWIDALINSKVEHLEICIAPSFHTELPSSILNWSTIRVLKFKGVTFSTLSSVNLPSLKVLDLDMVRLQDINFLAMLLSGCALLEMLVLTELNTNTYGPMQEIKRLNHLVAADVPPSLVPVKALSNVTFLRLQEIWSPGGKHVLWSPDAPIIAIFGKHTMWLPDADNIATFDNLTHLECLGDEWTAIVNCLQNFPKLQNLVISELFSRAPPEPSLNVPPCLSSHLKEFTFGTYRLEENAVAFMKFILNEARVLSTFKITEGLARSSEEEILEMLKEISLYPRASDNCKFLHVKHLWSSLNDWISGSDFDLGQSVGLLKEFMK